MYRLKFWYFVVMVIIGFISFGIHLSQIFNPLGSQQVLAAWTPIPLPTKPPTPRPTNTPWIPPTPTPMPPTATFTPVPTLTFTPTPTATPVIPTATPVPGVTPTATPVPTSTPTPAPTATPAAGSYLVKVSCTAPVLQCTPVSMNIRNTDQVSVSIGPIN